MKRDDYLSWDEYFMGIALLSAQRSKDSNTQVGACIVNQEHKIVSVGYNGMPTGCNDDDMPWGTGRRFSQHQIPLCMPCGTQCDSEPQRRQLTGMQLVCDIVPLQRMCKGDYSKRDSGNHLL